MTEDNGMTSSKSGAGYSTAVRRCYLRVSKDCFFQKLRNFMTSRCLLKELFNVILTAPDYLGVEGMAV
jgi:hypothetical protein